jgi:hypothetical protein
MPPKLRAILAVALLAIGLGSCAVQKPVDVSKNDEFESVIGKKDKLRGNNNLYCDQHTKDNLLTRIHMNVDGYVKTGELPANTEVEIIKVVKEQQASGQIEAYSYIAVVSFVAPWDGSRMTARIDFVELEQYNTLSKREVHFPN